MSFLSRRLAAAGAAALALGVSAGPALAGTGSSSTSAAKAKTPLVAEMASKTLFDEVNYSGTNGRDVDTNLFYSALQAGANARLIESIHADSAQLPAKLEWILGSYLEARGDNGLRFGEQVLLYHHTTTGKRAINAGLANYRLANYYIANADSQLGVPHRALEAEPSRLASQDVTPTEKRPYIADLSTASLVATIDSAAPVIDESIPSEVRTTSVTLNEAAVDYYGVVVGRLHVDSAQRPAQTEWAEGMHTLQQGDKQLDHAVGLSGFPLSATARREIASAFATLRRADSQISRADALLGIHQPKPTVTLPTKIRDRS
jgi:hypothetical protein